MTGGRGWMQAHALLVPCVPHSNKTKMHYSNIPTCTYTSTLHSVLPLQVAWEGARGES